MTEFKRTTQAVDEIEQLAVAAAEGKLDQLARLDQLVRDIGPVVEKLERKAAETDPTRQTYGPQMCEKVRALGQRWTFISSLAADVLGQHAQALAAATPVSAPSTAAPSAVTIRPGPAASGRLASISAMDASARPPTSTAFNGGPTALDSSASGSAPSPSERREMAARAAEARLQRLGDNNSASASSMAVTAAASSSASSTAAVQSSGGTTTSVGEGSPAETAAAAAQRAQVVRMDTLMHLVHCVFWGHGFLGEALGQQAGDGDGGGNGECDVQNIRRVRYAHKQRQAVVTTYVPVLHHLVVYAGLEGDARPPGRVALKLGMAAASVHAKTDYLLVYPLIYHQVVPSLASVPPEVLFSTLCGLAIPALAVLGCASKALAAAALEDDVLWWRVLISLPPSGQLNAAIEAAMAAQRMGQALPAGQCRRLAKAEVERAREEANARRRALEEMRRRELEEDRFDPLRVGAPRRPQRPFPGPFGGGGVFGGDHDLMPGGGFFGGLGGGRRPFGGGGGFGGGGFM